MLVSQPGLNLCANQTADYLSSNTNQISSFLSVAVWNVYRRKGDFYSADTDRMKSGNTRKFSHFAPCYFKYEWIEIQTNYV